jgi:mono/diheme cytochrome c family protein
MRRILKHAVPAAILGAASAPVLSTAALADAASISTGGGIAEGNGQAVYQHVCQGCHMPDGKGAVGSGAGFPAFAGNKKLENSGYPVYVVLNGLGGMPWFNGALSDAEVAGVVNYIRTHFGNSYTDPVKAADVAAVRGPAPTVER